MISLKSTVKLHLKWLKGEEKAWERLNLLPELSCCLSPVKMDQSRFFFLMELLICTSCH